MTRVVIAGAGVAGLEALLALHALAGDRADVTVLAAEPTFAVRAAGVGTAFGRGAPPEHDVAAIAAAHGARLHAGVLRAVHRGDRCAITGGGERLPFDALLVAVGARAEPAYPCADTFAGPADAGVVSAVLRELEAGRVASVAFVVPPGVTWPLPLYELALLTAAHAELHGIDAELAFVTPEAEPLAALGADVARHAAETLAAAGVDVLAGTAVTDVEEGGAIVGPGRAVLARPDRTIALARLRGPATEGLPHDERGFLPVDDRGRVPGLPGIHGAGDATAAGLKHGGLAAGQAEAAAHEIARAAGAPVAPRPARPVVRAELLEGAGRTWLRERGGTAVLARAPLWWPPLKVAAPRLAAYLAEERA
jgi:sulfide:quinone oxidoreductase